MRPSSSIPYYPLLDAARCGAISLVILHHVMLRFPDVDPGSVGRFLGRIGWSGVDIFFVISGFLITQILMKDLASRSTRAFFVKRAFRILPLYFVALLTYVAVARIGDLGRDLDNLWWNALLLTGWGIPLVGAENMTYAITWSLSVEEFAYVSFAMVAIMLRRNFPTILVGMVVVCLVLRVILLATGTMRVQDVYYFPATRIDSIAFGGLLALGWFQAPRRYAGMVSAAAAALIVWLHQAGQYTFGIATIGYTALPLVVAFVLGYATRSASTTHWAIRSLAYIGQRSYFIYLFHVFVIGALSLPLAQPLQAVGGFWGLSMLVLLITLAGAEISWRVFEAPLIRMGRELAARIAPSISVNRTI